MCLELKIKLHYHFIGFVITWLYIQTRQPKWAILEVGIGGRLDAANLFDADIAIITTVALDHCETLGNTIEQIALEKAHIARANKPIILGHSFPKNALNYLYHIKAKIIYAQYKTKMNNAFIHPNSIACALTALEYFPQKLNLPNHIGNLNVAGRFQIIQDKPLVIADVAHNPQAVEYLFQKIRELLIKSPKKRIMALFIANQHKDILSILNCGSNLVDLWLIPDLSRLDARFTPLNDNQKQQLFPSNSIFFDTPVAAFDYVTHNADEDELIVVFGSFVLIGELASYYDQRKH